MKALIPLTIAAVGFGGRCGPQEATPFRQYIEAEDCHLTDLKLHHNPLGGYIGDRFAYNIFDGPGAGLLTAPLRSDVPPGTVWVFVRAYCGDGPARSRLMTVRLGQTESSLRYPDEAFADKHNWLPFELATERPADRIEIETSAPDGGRVIVDSILVSNDPDDRTHSPKKGRTDLIARHLPDTVTPRAAGDGNMLVNSGFEVAPTNGWRSGYQSQWALTEELYDTSDPYERRRCLRVPLLRNKRAPHVQFWQTYDGIYAAPVRTEPGAEYTASVYVRADGRVDGVIGLKEASEKFRVEEAHVWQHVSATVEAAERQGAFHVSFTADEPRAIWLDAAQLERGNLTDYSPGPGADVGVYCNRPGRVFREGDPVELAWEVSARQADAEVGVRYQIHDALGRVLVRDELAVQARAGATPRIPLHSGPHPTGAFRVAYTVECPDAEPYSGQACYSVIPQARGERKGLVGVYASHARQCLAALAEGGIRWTNTLSSAGHFAEWAYVEPEEGQYVFHDDDIALARECGIRILANIDTTSGLMPKWALQDEPGDGEWIKHPRGYFRLADWEQFVYALVEHYRDDVKHWLIIDEPDGGTNSYSPEDYAALLRAAYAAAKRADPRCTVLGHAGTREDWHERVLALTGPEFFDAQYTYIGRFAPEVGRRLLAEAEELGRPLWTVDFAPVRKLSTHYAAVDPGEVPPWDETAANCRKYGIWAVRSLSWGRAEKWFRYDARYPGPPPGVSYMSIWEHDGSLTPHGVAIAAMNALIGDAQPQGEVAMAEGMEGHLFAAGGRKLLIAWTNDGTVRRLSIRGAAAWDHYGGRLDDPTVSPLPSFIEFTGDAPAWEAQVVERIRSELFPPEAPGEPYRGHFAYEGRGASQGEWVAAGPYFLERDATQRVALALGEDGRTELVLPLNVWPNLPIRGRQAEVKAYLPGRMLVGTLEIDTTEEKGQ